MLGAHFKPQYSHLRTLLTLDWKTDNSKHVGWQTYLVIDLDDNLALLSRAANHSEYFQEFSLPIGCSRKLGKIDVEVD